GKQDDELAMSCEDCIYILARGASVRVGENLSAIYDIRLFAVVIGHGHVAGSEPLVEAGQQLRILAQPDTERRGNRFTGQVVFGGPETAREDDNIGALQ